MNDQKDQLISTILKENQTILKHLRIGLTRIPILQTIILHAETITAVLLCF